jgi:MFS transporter, DHA1 family, inner membrane transport protein
MCRAIESTQVNNIRPIDKPLSLWTLLIATAVNEAMLNLLPSFVGALGDDLRLSPERLGLLGSADLIGIALSTATGPLWLRRVSWKRTGVGALIAFAIANAACFGVTGFAVLMTLRFVTGLIAGVGYTIGLAGVMDTSRPDRNAGLLLVVQVLFSAMGLFVIDAVPVKWRLDSVYAFMLVWTVPCIVLAWRHYPEDPGERSQAAPLDWGRLLAGRGGAVVAGGGIYFLMIGGVWGYLEGIAREAGLTLIQTGQALSSGLVISLAGAGLAAYLGLRLGRAIPLLLSAVIQITSLYLLTHLQNFSHPVLAFYLINAVFQIMWSYIIPYFMIMFAEVEPTGRFVSMYGMVTHLTLAIGPYAGAFFIVNGHHNALIRAGIGLVVLCYGAFLIAVRLGRHEVPGPLGYPDIKSAPLS